MDVIKKFVDLSFKRHLFIGYVLRILLVLYADYHDSTQEVPYTDIDYIVFTDAGRHIVQGGSPYKRRTYRYSPVIAFLMVPNVVVYKNIGKLLFSFFDLLLTIAVKTIVNKNLSRNKLANFSSKQSVEKIATNSALWWLYNPLSIAISTRGNADSLQCVFIMLSLLFLQTDVMKSSFKYAICGVMLGVSIHLRLYPLSFSFPIYLSVGVYKINRQTNITDAFKSLIPNKIQILVTLSCVVTLVALTCVMYMLYGFEFVFETYFYHLVRRDTKHNFSVLFYYSYLACDVEGFDIVKILIQVLACCILLMLSLTFGTAKETLCFGLFSQAVVMVTFNSVMTSQYFTWFLSLLPLVVHDLNVKPGKAFFLALVWVLTQAAWLFYAYLLEFKSMQVFFLIWLKGVVFFCTNVYILVELIRSYVPGYSVKNTSEFQKTMRI